MEVIHELCKDGRQVLLLLADDDPAEHILLKRKLKTAQDTDTGLDYVGDIGGAADIVGTGRVDMVFLDTRLAPNSVFRETAPQLRNAGFIGSIE